MPAPRREPRRREHGIVSQGILLVLASALAGVLVAGLALPFVGALSYGTSSLTDQFESLPSQLRTPPLPQRSRMLAADGRVIATFYDQNRIDVPLAQIAPTMQDALVAIEDHSYKDHGAIDLKGTLRAFVRNHEAGAVTQGGSTITQQYVKQVLVESATTPAERRAATADTYARKLQELRYAIALEQQYSKDQILGRYLNIVYFGDGTYGVEAAARHYFNVSASKLNIQQAATLAGLVRDPNGLAPTQHPKAALTRRNLVLSKLAEYNYITPAQAAAAEATPLGLDVHDTPQGCFSSWAPFFCQYAFDRLLADPALGDSPAARKKMIEEGGLTIKTSLDPKIQAEAVQAVRSHVYPTDQAIGGLVMIQPGTGLIKAMAQSRPMGDKKGQTFLNYDVQAAYGGTPYGFQPGSTMKIFVLAAAIKQGISLTTQIPSPAVYTSTEATRTCQGWVKDKWVVHNSTGSGTFNLVTATTHSVNTFYAQLEQQTGICEPATIAGKLGVTRGDGSPLLQVKSFTLGTNNVAPISMADAYATFAARGVHCTETAVTSVVDRNGNALPIQGPDCKQVVPRDIADAVNYVLHQNMDGSTDPGRTGASVMLQGRQSAGKTGTNDSNKAVWFIGYTPTLAAAAFVADAHTPVQTLNNQSIGGKDVGNDAFGSTLAGPIWHEAMTAALAGTGPANFTPPDPQVIDGVKVAVPNTVGMTEKDAIKALKDAGFVGVPGGSTYSYLAAGTVAKQSKYGEAPSGSTIYLTLSNGQPPPPPPPVTKSPKPSPPPTKAPPTTSPPPTQPTKPGPPVKQGPPKKPHG